MSESIHADYIFNSPLETAIRSLCVLVVDDTLHFDLQQLLAFDHLVVHSGDLNESLASLHPKVLQRNGELLVRRSIVEKGLLLMESKNLVERYVTRDGFHYSATELAVVFVESLTNPYVSELYLRSKWAVQMHRESGDQLFTEVFKTAFDRWSREFQIAELPLR